MNKCNEDFIKRRGINLSNIDSTIYDIEDINEIVAKFDVQGQNVSKNVSVAQILGIYNRDDHISGSYPEVLDSFFDYQGDGYHTRSLSMLEYDEENVINGLMSSFKEEPMVLIEGESNKYLIMSNGMHRFLCMRLLYLSAKSKCKNELELSELIKKYTIPVEVVQIDYIKTYCKYLINLFQPINAMGKHYFSIEEIECMGGMKKYRLKQRLGWDNIVITYLYEEDMELLLESYIGLDNEYDDNFKKTGRSILTKFNNEKLILTDEELIAFTKEIIQNSKKKTPELLSRLKALTQRYDSFNEFLKTYFMDIFDFDKEEIKEDDSVKTV